MPLRRVGPLEKFPVLARTPPSPMVVTMAT